MSLRFIFETHHLDFFINLDPYIFKFLTLYLLFDVNIKGYLLN